MIAAIRVIIREVFYGGFLGECITPALDDDVEQSLERGRLDVVDVDALLVKRDELLLTLGRKLYANDGKRSLYRRFESSDDEKFVLIDYESQNAGETANSRFGPDAILLAGSPTEGQIVREMLNDMGADFIDLITCTKEMYETISLRGTWG